MGRLGSGVRNCSPRVVGRSRVWISASFQVFTLTAGVKSLGGEGIIFRAGEMSAGNIIIIIIITMSSKKQKQMAVRELSEVRGKNVQHSSYACEISSLKNGSAYSVTVAASNMFRNF